MFEYTNKLLSAMDKISIRAILNLMRTMKSREIWWHSFHMYGIWGFEHASWLFPPTYCGARPVKTIILVIKDWWLIKIWPQIFSAVYFSNQIINMYFECTLKISGLRPFTYFSGRGLASSMQLAYKNLPNQIQSTSFYK